MDLLHEVLCFCYGLFHKAHENKLNISDLVSNKKKLLECFRFFQLYILIILSNNLRKLNLGTLNLHFLIHAFLQCTSGIMNRIDTVEASKYCREVNSWIVFLGFLYKEFKTIYVLGSAGAWRVNQFTLNQKVNQKIISNY